MHFDQQKWESDPRKLARDADFAAADAERARQAEQERIEAEAAAEEARSAAEQRAKLEHTLRENIYSVIDAAAALQRHGVSLHEVARVAGRAVAQSRYTPEHPLGGEAAFFFAAIGETAVMGLG